MGLAMEMGLITRSHKDLGPPGHIKQVLVTRRGIEMRNRLSHVRVYTLNVGGLRGAIFVADRWIDLRT